MSVPGVAPKGCNLDLTLAGSRVAMVHAIKYSTARPLPITLNNATQNLLLREPTGLSGGSTNEFPISVTSDDVTGNVSSKSSRFSGSSCKRLRFGQLPPFQISTEKCPHPRIVPCDDANKIAKEIRHRLTLSEHHSSSGQYVSSNDVDSVSSVPSPSLNLQLGWNTTHAPESQKKQLQQRPNSDSSAYEYQHVTIPPDLLASGQIHPPPSTSQSTKSDYTALESSDTPRQIDAGLPDEDRGDEVQIRAELEENGPHKFSPRFEGI